MRRRDALRLLLLSPLTLRPARLARSAAAGDAVACYRAAIESLPAWTEAERAILDAFATSRLDMASARVLRRGRATMAALSLGARAEGCDWLDYWTGARFTEVSWVFVGSARRLALLRARFAFEAGLERRGLADVSDVLSLAEHFTRGRVFIAQLIGFASEHAAIEAAAAALPRLSAIGLATLSTRFNRREPLPTLEETIQAERDFFLGYARPNEPEVYDEERTARLLPFYDRLIEASRTSEDTTIDCMHLAPDGDPADCRRFLDNFEGHRRARAYLEVKRAMLQAAIACVRDGPGAIESSNDPFDGRTFGLRSWSTGFELTSRFPLPGRPPAALLVGSR